METTPNREIGPESGSRLTEIANRRTELHRELEELSMEEESIRTGRHFPKPTVGVEPMSKTGVVSTPESRQWAVETGKSEEEYPGNPES